MAGEWGRRVAALDRWFDGHYDLITTAECELLGFYPAARRRLEGEGRLARVHPGVYARGRPPVDPAMKLRGAVCAGGPGAAASHLSAAWWWGLVTQPPPRPHITVPTWRRVRLPTVAAHQAEGLAEVRSSRGLPVTTPERTAVDLAGHPEIGTPHLAGIVDLAVADGLTTVDRLVEAARVGGRRRGAPRLRRLLEDRGYLGAPGASVLEQHAQRLFAELARTHGLELPVVEHRQLDGRYRLDFAWPRLMLAVEVKGFAWHRRPDDLDHDDERVTDLTLAGWTVIPFTWQQVLHQPEVFCNKVLAAYRQAEARAHHRR